MVLWFACRWGEVVVDVSESAVNQRKQLTIKRYALPLSLQSCQTALSWTCRHRDCILFQWTTQALYSPRQSLLGVEQINDGDVGPGELDESFSVDGSQVIEGPNGDR